MPVNLAVVDPTEETQETIRTGAQGAKDYLQRSIGEVSTRAALGRAQFTQDVAGGFASAEDVARPFVDGGP